MLTWVGSTKPKLNLRDMRSLLNGGDRFFVICVDLVRDIEPLHVDLSLNPSPLRRGTLKL
jgi:hypothetical protein